MFIFFAVPEGYINRLLVSHIFRREVCLKQVIKSELVERNSSLQMHDNLENEREERN